MTFHGGKAPEPMARTGFGRMAPFLGISAGAHLLFFLAVIGLVHFEMPHADIEAVQVELVSFAAVNEGGNPIQPSGGKVPAPLADAVPRDTVPVDMPEDPAPDEVNPPANTAPPAEPEPVATLKPDVSLKAKPKNLQELMASNKREKKPPRPDPETELKKAREALAQKEEARKKQQLADTLARLEQSVKQRVNHTASNDTSNGPSTGSGSGVAGGGTGEKGYSPIDLYKMVLKSAIEQNWVFNDLLAGLNQSLEVRVLIKILKNGEIRDVSYETRSGNRYLDQSAKRAIQRANPLPPLPKGMASYDVVVLFSPKGLK